MTFDEARVRLDAELPAGCRYVLVLEWRARRHEEGDRLGYLYIGDNERSEVFRDIATPADLAAAVSAAIDTAKGWVSE